jgi:hypothetical protein
MDCDWRSRDSLQHRFGWSSEGLEVGLGVGLGSATETGAEAQGGEMGSGAWNSGATRRGEAGPGVARLGIEIPRRISMRLGALLICLGALLAATALSWSKMSSRRSIKQVYMDVKTGRMPRVGVYAMIIAPVSLALIIAGMYLALTWR